MTNQTINSKRCPTCKAVKPLTDFAKNRARKDGAQDKCKPCYKTYQREYQRTPKGKEVRRHARLKNVFGIGINEYNHLLNRQDGGCAICHAKPGGRRLDIDHEHSTGVVRGLLCRKHNQALGLFNDDPQLLEAAIRYLMTCRSKSM